MNISDSLICLTKKTIFKLFVFIFILKLDSELRELLIIYIFFSSSELDIWDVCFQLLVDILHLGSGSVDPHKVDSDPGPGRQNVADPTVPDPKSTLNSS